jgi:hypothetical protein
MKTQKDFLTEYINFNVGVHKRLCEGQWELFYKAILKLISAGNSMDREGKYKKKRIENQYFILYEPE